MRARLVWLLVTVVACSLFATAGFWQLGRGQQKEALLERFEQALQAEPVDLDSALQQAELPRPARGSLTRLGDTPWLLLDNQRRGNAVGVRAFAIYQSAAAQPVLVDFGWRALPATRQLPPLPSPPDSLNAHGLLVAFPAQGLRLADNLWNGEGSGQVLLAYLDPTEINARLGLSLATSLLRLSPDLPTGFTRDLDALPNTLPAEKHYGYAFQWFGFAAAAACIFLILSLRATRP